MFSSAGCFANLNSSKTDHGMFHMGVRPTLVIVPWWLDIFYFNSV